MVDAWLGRICGRTGELWDIRGGSLRSRWLASGAEEVGMTLPLCGVWCGGVWCGGRPPSMFGAFDTSIGAWIPVGDE